MLLFRYDRIDFFRGVVILDMMLVHYSKYLTLGDGNSAVSRLIGYTDIAVEGFIFLFGFMIGIVYYRKFITSRKNVILRLLRRILQILCIHYIMILSIILPLWLIAENPVNPNFGLSEYLYRSFLLLTQPPLLHILPTFIPLLILAIPTLFLFEMGCEVFVVFLSLFAFVVGNIDPYILNVGEKTIFPIILWQIYFVFGAVLGKRASIKITRSELGWKRYLPISICWFAVMAFIYHGHHAFEWVDGFREKFHIVVSKFPLNVFGLMYHGALLVISFALIDIFYVRIVKFRAVANSVILMGRNSFTSFVIHIYFAELIYIMSHLKYISLSGAYGLIALNIFFTLIFLRYLENKKQYK
ncbi:OpgC domain-containing protein [Thermodesulfobacteriota bacterium]